MRKQITIAAVLAVVALGASAQTRMEATGPFTYEALGATPSLKVRSTSPAATIARKQRPAPAGGSEARSNPLNYEAVGATPHVEAKRPPASTTTQLQPTVR